MKRTPTALSDPSEQFLRDLAIGQSKETVRTYRNALTRFEECGATLDAAGPLVLARWIADKGRSKSTLKTYLSAISQYYSYLLRKRLIEIDAAALEDMNASLEQFRKGSSKKLPKLPADEDVDALLRLLRSPLNVEAIKKSDRARRTLERLRDIALFEALRMSGARVGELVGLKRGDLNYRDHSARVTGKGDKQRDVDFGDDAWDALMEYLRKRGDGTRNVLAADLPVFAQHGRNAGKKIKPLTTNRVREIFQDLCDRAEIEFHMTPHTLRHAFATKILEATNDLAVVQDMLGHSSPVTTRIYAKVSRQRMREAHRLAFRK